MNTTEILNQIRIGNEHTGVPDDIRAIIEHELALAEDSYQQLLSDGAPEIEARLVSTACAIMHVLGVTTDEQNHS